MRFSIHKIDPNIDIIAYCSQTGAKKPKPPLDEFEAYESRVGPTPIKRDPVPVGTSITKRESIAIKNPTPPAPIINSSPYSIPVQPAPTIPSTPPLPAPGALCKVRALHDYAGESNLELSFKAGDIIIITQKDGSGWWQGELNGKVGAVPSEGWVQEIETYAPQYPPKSVSPRGLQGASTIATSSHPISPRGGRPGGFSGNSTIPPAYTRPAPVQNHVSPPPAQKKCKALFDFTIETEGEVELKLGDIISIDSEDSGWYYGTNQRTGLYGRFPTNYVQLL